MRPGLLVCSARIVVMSPSRPTRRSTRPSMPKRADRLAGLRVDRGEVTRVDVQQALFAAVGAAPVVHAARADGAFVGVRPKLAARRGVERDDRAALREHVHRVADDERIERVVLGRRIRPRDFELADVALVDLRRATSTATNRRRRGTGPSLRSRSCRPERCGRVGARALFGGRRAGGQPTASSNAADVVCEAASRERDRSSLIESMGLPPPAEPLESERDTTSRPRASGIRRV